MSDPMSVEERMVESGYQILRRDWIPEGRFVPPRAAVAAVIAGALRTRRQLEDVMEDDSRDDDG